ncbi:hypothetical protein GCM10010985_48350 [Caballeronia grimmiae]|uniref:Transposase n=1 Tax=Caballeronia grimmiae TaxID=1071679 RepID=A0ABQ1S0D4_9BURK|nr:hypothetical protein GCM10010985_48350 [Caballeronia grimmiae]
MRRSRHHTLKTEGRTNIRNAVSISEPPAAAEDRAIPGHWEGDLLYSYATSQIATLVERRFVMRVKVARKDSKAVVDALIPMRDATITTGTAAIWTSVATP